MIFVKKLTPHNPTNIMKFKITLHTLPLQLIAVILFISSSMLAQNRPAGQVPNAQTPSSIKLNLDEGTKRDLDQKQATVQNHLNSLVKKGVLTAIDTGYKITSEHVSSLSGVHHIYYRQAINGIEISGTEASMHIRSTGAIAASHDKSLLKNINASVKSSTLAITAPQAIQAIASQMNYGSVSALQEITTTKKTNGIRMYTKGGISSENIPAKQMYYVVPNDGIRMVWEISIQEINSSDWWNFRVDAATGTIIDKYNLTISCNLADGRDHSEHLLEADTDHCMDTTRDSIFSQSSRTAPTTIAADGASYNVYAAPLESPYFGIRTTVVNPADPISSPFGWHDTNGVTGAEFTITSGNNTLTVDDINASNTGGTSPDGGVSLVFDYPIEATQNQGGIIVPLFQTNNRSLNAAISNTFYWTNIIHDITYHYGFDEASGNFQVSNYGNGGAGGDPVQGDVQDGSDTCNANFGTPRDGFAPRMQMFICANNDSAFDNLVIVHEYAHGISTRLTGGAGNSGSLSNQEQQGEGWSDYYGYMITMSSSNFTNDRTVGTFLGNQGPNGPGIRTFPYSGNMATNSQGYQDLINIGDAPSAPHPIGEIWASILYDLTQDLIATYGFDPDLYNGTAGNNISLALVTEGLKLQPASPGFVDSRDAILLADQLLYGGANQCIIWESFAARGLGFSADQGSSNSRADGTTAFDVPPITLEVSTNDFCTLGGVETVSGGLVGGGAYSGPGVTDDGNGATFTFDPVAAGLGTHTISYTALDCNGNMGIDTDTISVTEILPEISECQDVTLQLGTDGTATYDPFASEGLQVDIVGGNDGSGNGGFTIFFVPGNLITQTTTVSFDWELITPTSDLPEFDSFGYLIGTTVFSLSPDVDPIETGTFSVEVPAGQNFGFVVITNTNTLGPALASVTNFLPGYSGQFDDANWQEFNQTADGTASFSGNPAPTLRSCGEITTSLSQEVFTCLDIGTTTPVTITVTDSAGNEDSCTANVTITGSALNTTTFTGGVWDNGDPTGTSTAILNDDYDTATLGDINACSCEVQTGNTLTVRDGNFMNIAGNITVEGTLIVENEGSIVQIDENAITTNNGTIEIRKTTPELNGRGFVVLSSPMTGETRNDVFQNADRVWEIQPNLFTPHPDVTSAINFIDENFDYFVAPYNVLESGRGYLVFPQAPQVTTRVTLDHTHTLGTLNSGPINYALEYNGPSTENNFNVVGNPYASAIDANMLISSNDAIDQIFYWEHLTDPTADNPGDNTSNHSMDDVSIYNLMGGIPAVNGGSAPGPFMVSGQGFGVIANQSTLGAPLRFTNAMRVSGNNGTVRSSGIDVNRLWLSLSNDAETTKSTTLLGFTPDATPALDAGYDSPRLDASINIFSTTTKGDLLSIQAREAFDSAIEIGLGFSTKITESKTYAISIDQLEGSSLENAVIFLIDNDLDIITNLKESAYAFTAAESIQSSRFTLVFEEQLLQVSDENVLDSGIHLFPNPAKNEITLFYTGAQSLSTATIINLNGKIVSQIDLNNFNQSKLIDVSAFSTGVYFLRVESNSNAIVKRLIIN